MKKALLLLILLPVFYRSYAQQNKKLDSLNNLLAITKEDTNKVNILNELCKYYINTDATRALGYCKKAIEVSEKLNWNSGKISSYNNTGRVYYVLYDTAKCMYYYTKALGLSKLEHNRKMEGYILGNIGLVDAQKFDYEKALGHYNEALKIDRERNDRSAEIKALNNIGLAYRSMSDFPRSLEYFLKALKINKEIKDAGLGANLYYIGIVYQDMGDYKNALKYGLEADELLSKSGNKFIEALNYGQIGATYSYLKLPGKALEYLQKGYDLNMAVGNKQAATIITTNIGNIYLTKNDFAKSLSYFQKALKDAHELGDTYSEATTLDFMSRAYVGLKDYPQAVKYGEKAVALSRETKDVERLVSALDGLSSSYEKMNIPGKALAAYRESVKLKDSTINVDKQKEITRKQMQFDFDIKQARMKDEQDKRDAIAKEIRQKEKVQRNELIGGGAFFVLLSGLLFFGYRQNSKKNVLLNARNAAIEARDKEKELLMKELHHRVKNNLQIVSSLLRMQSRQLKDENAIYAIQDSRNRVEAMALIHQKLYQGDALTDIYMPEYIANLLSNISSSYGIKPEQMQFELKIEEKKIDVEKAIPLGLILNELISNAFKHAYEGIASPCLEIILKFAGDGLFIKVHDNGKGMPDNFNLKESTSFGLDLVNSLVKQLHGKISMINDNGSSFEIMIPKI